MDKIISGLQTFRNADGTPVIREIHRTAELGYQGPCEDQLPELVIEWNDRVVTPLASSALPHSETCPRRDGQPHGLAVITGDAWALVVPGSSKLRSPTRTPHIVDIVPTVCAAVSVDHDGLSGEPLLEQRPHP